MEEKQILWDDVIPQRIIIPGKSEMRQEPQGVDLVLEKVPDVDYALYKIEYKRSRLFPSEERSFVKINKQE